MNDKKYKILFNDQCVKMHEFADITKLLFPVSES